MARDRIEEFHVHVPQDALDDLRRRLSHTRLPERETVGQSVVDMDWSQGVPLGYLVSLADYWRDGYDWRRFESELNSFQQGLTRIHDLDVHFLHEPSPRPDAIPLLLTHGWPSSVIEPMQVMRTLAHSGSVDEPAFHVVAPSLPGFGFSGRPAWTGWSIQKIASAWAELMTRLGYGRFAAAGGDWGGRVTTWLGVAFHDRVDAIHTFSPYVPVPPADGDLTPHEARRLARTREFWAHGGGYSLEQSTKPQTLAYGLTDSPAGQLAWIVEKLHGWTDCDGHPENAISRDRILDVVSLYWLTATAGSSARIYWENHPPERTAPVLVPSAVSVFAKDIEIVPRSWVEARFRNLQYWNEVDHGGHFPMLEAPVTYAAELRRALTTLLAA